MQQVNFLDQSMEQDYIFLTECPIGTIRKYANPVYLLYPKSL